LVNPGQLYGVASAFSVMVFFILLLITLGQNRVMRGLEGWSDA
jgi:ABC-type sugar transport system permease subunit